MGGNPDDAGWRWDRNAKVVFCVHQTGVRLWLTQLLTMTSGIVLWIYIVLLVAGGVAGFVKAGSKPSLIAASVFAAALVLCQLQVLRPAWVVDLLLGLLVVVFVIRLVKTKKFMPAGLMVILTVSCLALRHAL